MASLSDSKFPGPRQQQAKKPIANSVAAPIQAPLAQALSHGFAGAGAMAVNVTTLMWVRTTTYFQYRHGLSTSQAIRALYKEGGIRRFYSGYSLALFHGPLSRFGDTAANAGVLCALDTLDSTRSLPIAFKSVCASAAAAGFRILIMPIDTVKSVLQVEGKSGISILMNKVRTSGPKTLYHGSLAAASATFLGHYPWFATFNYLDTSLPQYDSTTGKLFRSAVIGFTSSAMADLCSNSVRVLKTFKQTNGTSISYYEAGRCIVAQDGMQGLFARGLKTKLLGNGLQGIMFSIIWKYLKERNVNT